MLDGSQRKSFHLPGLVGEWPVVSAEIDVWVLLRGTAAQSSTTLVKSTLNYTLFRGGFVFKLLDNIGFLDELPIAYRQVVGMSLVGRAELPASEAALSFNPLLVGFGVLDELPQKLLMARGVRQILAYQGIDFVPLL